MSNLRIMEHRAPPGNTVAPIMPGEYMTTQNVAIGANTQSNAFGPDTTMVHLQAEAICTVKFGANPTAVAGTGYRFGAGDQQTFFVAPGSKVACVSDT